MKRWDELVDQYIGICHDQGLTASTIRNRQSELYRWGSYLKTRRPKPKLEEITHEQIIGYIKTRSVCKSKPTISGIISNLRCFGKYLVQSGYWNRNPLNWIQGPRLSTRRKLGNRLNRSQLESLLKSATIARDEFTRKLWLAIITLFYGTGIRRGELIRLNITDYHPQQHCIYVDGRKTGIERRVPVPPMAAELLDVWVAERNDRLARKDNIEEQGMFINAIGNRISAAGVSNGLKRLAKRCGIGHVTCYYLRHSCASDLISSGIGLPEIQEILGHQRISTTMYYTDISCPQRHEAMKKHPINTMLELLEDSDV